MIVPTWVPLRLNYATRETLADGGCPPPWLALGRKYACGITQTRIHYGREKTYRRHGNLRHQPRDNLAAEIQITMNCRGAPSHARSARFPHAGDWKRGRFDFPSFSGSVLIAKARLYWRENANEDECTDAFMQRWTDHSEPGLADLLCGQRRRFRRR